MLVVRVRRDPLLDPLRITVLDLVLGLNRFPRPHRILEARALVVRVPQFGEKGVNALDVFENGIIFHGFFLL